MRFVQFFHFVRVNTLRRSSLFLKQQRRPSRVRLWQNHGNTAFEKPVMWRYFLIYSLFSFLYFFAFVVVVVVCKSDATSMDIGKHLSNWSTLAGYLTVIPQARMGSESIAHEAEGRMGY